MLITIIKKTGGRVLLTLTSISMLAGCEAPLNLEGVEAEKQKSVRRTDQLQAVTISQGTITVVGSEGVVLSSPANTLNWSRTQLPENPNLIDIETCPDHSLIALSMERELWRSTDQGQSWVTRPIPTYESLIDITCGPDNSIWATGSFSTLVSSDDGGENWSEISLNEDATLSGLQFFDRQSMIVTGEFGLLATSADGGANWNLLDPIPNEFFPLASHFVSPDTGWVGGLGGSIMVTRDGGRSWQHEQAATKSPIYNFLIKDQRMFAFGDHGTVLERIGSQWQAVQGPGIPIYLRDGVALDKQQLLVAGGAGTLTAIDI